MALFDNLEKFDLRAHGDGREREWWFLLEGSFPAYQAFWQRHVVLLTNRIDSSIQFGDERWSRLRADIPLGFEKMAMHHYSIFYFLARATERLRATDVAFYAEDVFYLLDTCGDNLARFREKVRQIVDYLSGPRPFWAKEPKHECPAIREIAEYRNAMLHNAVLGRAVGKGREYLPVLSRLPEVEDSWRQTEKLSESDWVDARLLLEKLQRDLCGYLQSKWEEILPILDKLRDTRQFKTVLELDPRLPIAEPPIVPSTNQPQAASGSLFATQPTSGFVTLSSNTERKD